MLAGAFWTQVAERLMVNRDYATSATSANGTANAPDAVTDDALMQRVQTGDEHAFAILFARYHGEIRTFVTARLGGDLATADDIAGDVFTKVYRYRDRFHGGSFRGWLYQIARTTIIDHHRASTTRTAWPIDNEPDLVSNAPTPETIAIASEAREQLLSALGTLSPVPRRIVELRLKGYPLDAICADLGMELSAVKSAQHRAFRKLRDLLQEPATAPLSDPRNHP